MSRAIGNPIKVDAATLQFQSGYYAKVLIEIDFAKTIPNKLWIMTKYGAFSQGVILTNLPKFCTKCKIVGHLPTECRVKQSSNIESNAKQVEKEIIIEKKQNHISSPPTSEPVLQTQIPVTQPCLMKNLMLSLIFRILMRIHTRFRLIQS